jgi:2-C-methyl-D-erythritol 2,4-cyclodiphosphate synthase
LSQLGRAGIIRADWFVDRRSPDKTPGDRATSFNLRVGIGEDSHRTAPGGPLRLGGIDVPHDRKLVGHSDADVLLHAITDALLGAAALPDIGRMFPDTDPANRSRDSADMLALAAQKVREQNYRIVNLDCVVHAERPRLADYQEAMRHRIAGILHVSPLQIGLKAKTGEGVGPVGHEELIEARCIALLQTASDA